MFFVYVHVLIAIYAARRCFDSASDHRTHRRQHCSHSDWRVIHQLRCTASWCRGAECRHIRPADRLLCASTANAAGAVSVEVTNNNQDYTGSSVPFVHTPTTYSLSVDSGPAGGATLSGDRQQLCAVSVVSCLQVRTSVAMATLQSVSLVSCYTPPHTPALVTVSVSNNNQDFGVGVDYTYNRT